MMHETTDFTCLKPSKMKNTFITTLCLMICLCSAAGAAATETLDCHGDGYFIRMHINSFSQVADLEIDSPENKTFKFDDAGIELIGFGWEKNGFGATGNFIHLKAAAVKLGAPSFELNVKEGKGFLLFREKKRECACEWGTE